MHGRFGEEGMTLEGVNQSNTEISSWDCFPWLQEGAVDDELVRVEELAKKVLRKGCDPMWCQVESPISDARPTLVNSLLRGKSLSVSPPPLLFCPQEDEGKAGEIKKEMGRSKREHVCWKCTGVYKYKRARDTHMKGCTGKMSLFIRTVHPSCIRESPTT